MTVIRERSRVLIPGQKHIEELTFPTAQTVTMQNPFAPSPEEDIDVEITQKATTALAEEFSWSLSGSVITIHSTNATSDAVVRVGVEGN